MSGDDHNEHEEHEDNVGGEESPYANSATEEGADLNEEEHPVDETPVEEQEEVSENDEEPEQPQEEEEGEDITFDENEITDSRVQHTHESKPVEGELGKDYEKEDRENFLHLMRQSPAEFAKTAERINQKMSLVDSKEGREWAEAMGHSVNNLLEGNPLLESFFRDGSYWDQVVEESGRRLSAARPQLGNTSGSLSGERAVHHVRGVLGLGSVIQIPLWHSGIWVSIKAPSDSELLVLDQRLAEAKVSLGNITSGLIFSNSSVHLTNDVVNFALDHVYDSTLADTQTATLRKVILAPDIPLLIWGLACAIYPNGYPMRRPCMADPNNCQHVHEALLHLPRLCWTDTKALTKTQRKHMVNRKAKHKVEHVRLYQNDGELDTTRIIKLTDKLAITAKIPSIDEYIDAGFEWIEGITEMIENEFGSTLRGEDRDRHIMAQGNVTLMRQYTHWVENILIYENGPDEEPRVAEGEAVKQLLSSLSGENKIRDSFFEKIGKFINDITFSIIGIPRYNCPNCGKPQGDEESEKHPYVIPIDTVNVFFTLQRRRLIQA